MDSKSENMQLDIIIKIEGIKDLELRHYYTEIAPERLDGELKIDQECSLYFKEAASNISVVISFSCSLLSISASVERMDSSKKYIFIDSYLKNSGKEALLQQTKHWNGQRWVTNFEKYLALVSDLITGDLKPVLKEQIWIDDLVDLDKYIAGKK